MTAKHENSLKLNFLFCLQCFINLQQSNIYFIHVKWHLELKKIHLLQAVLLAGLSKKIFSFCGFFSPDHLHKRYTNEIITRPNCALDRRTICCHYVPGFQKQFFEPFPKYKWNHSKKFPWIQRENTCNVNFVGTIVLSQLRQQANIANCSGFRNCKWTPQKTNGIRKCKFCSIKF